MTYYVNKSIIIKRKCGKGELCMNNQKTRPYNRKLFSLLNQYPEVFIENEEINKMKEEDTGFKEKMEKMKIEERIIFNIKNYFILKKKNTKKNCGSITVDWTSNHQQMRITIYIKNECVLKETTFCVSNYNKLIEKCFTITSNNYSEYYILLSSMIVLQMIENNKDIITIPTSNIHESDATIELKNTRAKEAVEKLTAWMMHKKNYESSTFIKYFPHTCTANYMTNLIYNKEGKVSLNGFVFSFNKTSFKTTKELEHFLSTPNGEKYLLPQLRDAITEQTKQFLIWGYLWEQAHNPTQRLKDCMKNNSTIFISTKDKDTGDGIYTVKIHITSPVISVIRELKELLKRLTVNTPYTYIDFLHFLGYTAYFAAGKHYVVFDKAFYSFIEKELKIEKQYINAMLSKAEKNNLLNKETEGNYNKYIFTFKDYRLILEGMIIAYAYNKGRLKHESIASLILDQNVKFTGDSNINDTNHLFLSFDRFVVCNISLLYFSDNRETILDELCNIANDFSVQNRRKQIQAIYLLSDFLIDGLPVSSALRNKIWRSTFGTSMYPFMWQKIWPLLSQDRNSNLTDNFYFLEYIKTTFYISCVIDEDGYSKGDPYFNFWICFININKKEMNQSKVFLIKTSKVYRYFWESNQKFLPINCDESSKHKYSISDIIPNSEGENIVSLIDEANVKMEEHLKSPNEDILYYVNGIQNILYTLADFSNFHKKGGDVIVKLAKLNNIEENTLSSSLIRCCVLCDYLTRKYNRKYNKQDYNSMYMLCGPFRLICAYCISCEEYIMSEEMIKDYTKWIENEHNTRYKALLYRLLSYTNYPTRTLRAELENEIKKIDESYNSEKKILSGISKKTAPPDNRINSIIKDEIVAIDERHTHNLRASFLHYDHITLNNDFLDNPKKLQ